MRKLACLFTLVLAAQTIAVSPYHLNAANEAKYAGTGLTAGVLSLRLQSGLQPLNQQQIQSLEARHINRLDRFAVFCRNEQAAEFSDYLLFSCAALPVLTMAHKDMCADAGKLGLMYTETLLLTAGLTNLTKVLAGRTRPFVYNPDIPVEDKLQIDARKSFFSGHTSLAFAGAVYAASISSQYIKDGHQQLLIWSSCLTLASGVAVCRVWGGRHFPTDVIAGAFAGGLIGYLVPALHQNSGSGEQAASQTPVLRLSLRW